MAIIKIFSIVLCLSMLIGCSSEQEDSDSGSNGNLSACEAFNFARRKIASGEVCSLGSQESPLVRLLINSFSGNGVCTGAVIDSNTILTAAHCLDGNVFSIIVETTNGNFTTSNFFIPNAYNDSGDVAFNDVALVKTNTPIGINPYPLLITSDVIIGETAYIAGFGENKPGSIDDSPRAGDAVIAGVTSQHIVIRYQGDQSHPCQGDSGGPLVVVRGSFKAIAGVVSQSDPSVDSDNICRPGDITLYTNMRSSAVLSFLNSLAPNAGAI